VGKFMSHITNHNSNFNTSKGASYKNFFAVYPAPHKTNTFIE